MHRRHYTALTLNVNNSVPSVESTKLLTIIEGKMGQNGRSICAQRNFLLNYLCYGEWGLKSYLNQALYSWTGQDSIKKVWTTVFQVYFSLQ